jgi:hypothetical protein
VSDDTGARDETLRLTANALIDFSASWDPNDTTDGNARSYETNLAYLGEIGAVSAQLDDDDVLELQMAPLINGAAATIHWLVGHLASASGLSREEIIHELRQFWAEP